MMVFSPNPVAAVLWDVDGTLLTSEPLHARVLRDLCAEYGLLLSDADCEALAGASMDEKWRRIDGDARLPMERTAWKALFNAKYAVHVSPELGRSAPLAALRRIQGLGIPQACVSNGEPDVVRTNLSVLEVADCFAHVIASDSFSRGKPDPMPYLVACERLGVAPEACLAVEDSRTGALAALAAGCHTVLWPPEDTPMPVLDDAIAIKTPDAFPWALFSSHEEATGVHPK